MDTPDIAANVLSEQTCFRLPSRPDWIEEIVAHLKTKAIMCGACHEARAGKLMIALHEAISNSIIHGNLELSSSIKERGDDAFAQALAARMADAALSSRHVDVEIDYDGQRCRWIITDEGPGFDVEKTLALASSDDPELLLASGRGILIMRSFLDEVRYELNGRRAVLTLLHESGTEKRQDDRQTVHHPLRIVPVREDGSVDWEAAYDAVSRNVSGHGLNLLQEKLNFTKRIIIGFPSEGNVLFVPAEIRHCRALAANMVEIGCRFQSGEVRPAAPAGPDAAVVAVHEAVAALLERVKPTASVGDERRAYLRVTYNERIAVRGTGAEQPVVVGFARDLAKGGIAFLTTVPLPLEERVIVLPQADGPALGLRARIVRCTRIKEGLFDIGARFVGLETWGNKHV